MLFEGTIKLPLSMDQLKVVLALKAKNQQEQKVLITQPVMAVVNAKDSTSKGASFITYISNLRLSVVLDEENEPSKEERFELLKCYLTSRMLADIKTLNECTMALLLERKGIAFDGDVFLSPEERAEFAQLHEELLVKYEMFLESILVGLPFCIKEYASTIGKDLIESKVLPVVNKPDFISSNVVSIIMEPDFLELYLSLPIKHQPAFYESQWLEPVFNGFSLISIISMNTSLFPFMQSMYEQWFTEEEIKSAS